VRRTSLTLLTLALAILAVAPALHAQTSPEKTVDLIEVTGVIDPPTSDYLISRLGSAEDEGIQAVVIQLDTPGALDVSMREIVGAILGSSIPTVVWIAPRGAEAASAGTFIGYAADLVYMAPETELGAATPIDLGTNSVALGPTAVDDAAAFIREIAIAQGHDPDFGERAVREKVAVAAPDAVELGAVNGMAGSLRELLEALDGQAVDTNNSGQGPILAKTLETWDEGRGAPSVTVRFQQMDLLQRLLHAVTSPEVAFYLLLLGMFGLIFELYNPGIGLAAILGAGCLVLGFYALSVLPTNWAGVLLVVLAVVFLLADLHVAGLGLWTAAGIAALIAGGSILFSGAAPALSLSPWAIVGAIALTLIFFISVMTAALRVRLRRPITGEEGIVGSIAEAKTDIAPEGTVLTKGTLWRARTMETGIAAGSKVEVKATEGLVLLVEPLHDPHADA
jgi:membrane-bound serine protease (ClpP class)